MRVRALRLMRVRVQGYGSDEEPGDPLREEEEVKAEATVEVLNEKRGSKKPAAQAAAGGKEKEPPAVPKLALK